MLGVVLVYTGFLLGLVALLSLVRPLRFLGIANRKRALGIGGLAVLIVVGGMALPAPLHRVEQSVTRLDEIVPAWQFGEHHATRIHASPQQVEAAVRAVTAGEIRLFRLLTWIRNPRLPGSHQEPSLLAPPVERPILEVALDSGFMVLAEEPGRELVFGTLVLVPDEVRHLPADQRAALRAAFTPARFATLADPGYAKAVMSFHLADEGDGWVRLTTETRVVATSAHARRRFAAYWRTIYPGSSLLRRTWLAAIRRRAEAAAGSPPATP